MKKMIISLFLVLAFNSQIVQAADGSSGCGPAWYVLKDNSILSSALRATTNGILGLTVTFGMTFGTSNCTKHSIVKREKESLKFATENYFELAADSVKGSGKFLSAFATTMGCSAQAIPLFKEKMQKKFNETFNLNKQNAKELILNTYKVILNDKTLIQSCIVS